MRLTKLLPLLTPAIVAIASRVAGAQGVFSDVFPPEEFAARRADLIRRVGDGVAIIQGATEYPAYARNWPNRPQPRVTEFREPTENPVVTP